MSSRVGENVRIAVGFGATSRASGDDVLALVRATLRAYDIDSLPFVVATLDRRASLAHAVGAALGCDVVTFDAATLARVAGFVTSSQHALASVGTPSVAEAAALAAYDALDTRARLVAPRATGRNCTCAIAESI